MIPVQGHYQGQQDPSGASGDVLCDRTHRTGGTGCPGSGSQCPCGLSDLLLEFGFFTEWVFLEWHGRASLWATGKPSQLRLMTRNGHTPGPPRAEDTGQG